MQNIPVKILISGILVIIVFYPRNIIEFLKVFSIFCFSAIIVAGTMFFVLNLSGGNFVVVDGICFVKNSSNPWILITTVFLCVIFVKVFSRLKKTLGLKDRILIPLSISIDKKNICLAALIDTGNLLCDPLTNTPVIVAEYFALKEILPKEMTIFLDSVKDIDFKKFNDALYDSSWFKRLRIIPFSSLGNEKDLLIGFRPDLVEIGIEKIKTRDVIVGIYKQRLSKNKEFQALLGPQLI
jgi:stage II sporulation protein GA (sporulation sigma-E factor processing peptidase)